jgi:hypothetical protein
MFTEREQCNNMNKADTSPMQRTTEQAIIEQAALAAERKLGVGIRVRKELRTARRDTFRPDAVIAITADGHTHRFVAEAKATDRIETLAYANARLRRAIEHGFPGYRPLLIAPYMTRALAGHCRKLKLPFLDMAGNAYLEAPGLFIYTTGEPRPDAAPVQTHRATTAAGARVVFALICRPELIQATYRELALAAGVALGTVGGVLDDLQARGFLRKGKRAPNLRNTRQLVDDWITHYAATLRPKLHPRRFQCEPALLLAADFKQLHAYWGGEVAGQRLTGYLMPEHFLIYLAGPLNPLLTQGHMRLADNGNTEILDAFWPEALIVNADHPDAGAAPLAPWAKSAREAAKFTQWRPAPGKQRGADPTGLGLQGSPARSSVKRVEWRSHSGSRANQKPRVVPPLLAYADLMITGEGRNLETAKLIYDKFLAPVFDA